MCRWLACACVLTWLLAPVSLRAADTIFWHFDPNSIDLNDLNNVRNNFGGTGLGDYTGDEFVDLEDLNFVRNRFGAPDLDPPSWVDPVQPTDHDLISYYLDFGGGSNACWATINAGGAPYFLIDDASREIRIAFDPNAVPDVCADVEDPVRGLTGEFGPLAVGDWTLGIAGEPPYVAFQVVSSTPVPEPGGIGLAAALAPLGFGLIRRRRYATQK